MLETTALGEERNIDPGVVYTHTYVYKQAQGWSVSKDNCQAQV